MLQQKDTQNEFMELLHQREWIELEMLTSQVNNSILDDLTGLKYPVKYAFVPSPPSSCEESETAKFYEDFETTLKAIKKALARQMGGGDIPIICQNENTKIFLESLGFSSEIISKTKQDFFAIKITDGKLDKLYGSDISIAPPETHTQKPRGILWRGHTVYNPYETLVYDRAGYPIIHAGETIQDGAGGMPPLYWALNAYDNALNTSAMACYGMNFDDRSIGFLSAFRENKDQKWFGLGDVTDAIAGNSQKFYEVMQRQQLERLKPGQYDTRHETMVHQNPLMETFIICRKDILLAEVSVGLEKGKLNSKNYFAIRLDSELSDFLNRLQVFPKNILQRKYESHAKDFQDLKVRKETGLQPI